MSGVSTNESKALSVKDIKGIFKNPDYHPCQASYHNKRKVYEFAERAYNQAESGSGREFSLTNFVSTIGGRIQCFDMDVFDELSGNIIVNDIDDIYIFIPNYTSTVRNRFTVAHEVGHYILHSPNARDGEKYIDNRFGTGRVETEANWFAAGLLVPTGGLRKYLEGDGGKDAFSIAMNFGVSGRVAEFRYNTLQECGF